MYGRFAAGPVSVRRDANARADGAHEKTCKRRPFRKRLKGFEPSTFCMASSCSLVQNAPEYLQNQGFWLTSTTMAFQEMPGNHRD